MPEHPLAIALLVLIVLLAVVVGLWFGRALGTGELATKMSKTLTWRNVGNKLRKATTRAMVKLWTRSRERRD